MPRGRACKICELSKSNPKVFNLIENQIKNGKKGGMSKFLREINKEHDINIISMNVQRHRAHMEANVTELKVESKDGNHKSTTSQNQQSTPISMNLDHLNPKYLLFLEKFRENGYRHKEKSWLDAGFGDNKAVYDALKKPEIRAAIYEMKAADFVSMRYTGNQVLSGIMEVAHFPEYWADACDEDGHLITNIKEWPEGLRHALCGYETTEDVLKSSDEDGETIIRRKFKYKFPDPLKARAELRKHAVEIEMFQKSNKQSELYEAIIEKLLLNQINPITAGLEIDKLDRKVPEALRIAMNKVDPSVLDKPPLMDSEDMSEYTDEELEMIASGDSH